MTIRNGVEKDSLANKYAADAPYGALFSADPGTAGNATNELPASGSPAYGRKAWNWSTSSGGAGVVTGTATFDVPSGQTPAFIGVCVSSVRTTADVRDSFDSVDQAFASQGTYAVTATYTQT